MACRTIRITSKTRWTHSPKFQGARTCPNHNLLLEGAASTASSECCPDFAQTSPARNSWQCAKHCLLQLVWCVNNPVPERIPSHGAGQRQNLGRLGIRSGRFRRIVPLVAAYWISCFAGGHDCLQRSRAYPKIVLSLKGWTANEDIKQLGARTWPCPA
eukprot:scaffold382_cov380-Prasinococcus_capsulatus_cf.AAC.34